MRKDLAAFILSLFFAGNCFGQISLLECHDKGWITEITEGYTILYKLNGEAKAYMACGGSFSTIIKPQVIVAIIDPLDCEPWCTPGIDFESNSDSCLQNNFGQMNSYIGSCGWSWQRPAFYWNQADSISMDSLSLFLDNKVPDDAYILVYTWIPSPATGSQGTFLPWLQNMLNSFHNLGFNEIDTVPLNHPWIFFCKKGDITSAQKVIGTHPTDELDFSALICTDELFVSANSITICDTDSTTVSGNSGLLNYLWSTGDTSQTITVSEEGYYVLTGQLDSIYNSADSTYQPVLFTDSIYIEAISCTGIEEDASNTLSISYSISPNPAKENINITFNKPFSKQTQLNIYNVFGVLNKSAVIPSNKNNLDISVSDLASGVYFISVQTKNGNTASQKVIISN